MTGVGRERRRWVEKEEELKYCAPAPGVGCHFTSIKSPDFKKLREALSEENFKQGFKPGEVVVFVCRK